MAWKIPAHPEKRHPRKKFAFGPDTLYRLHVTCRASPREISRIHEILLGYTIRHQGVRNYLKVYGFYEPPGEPDSGLRYRTDYRRLESFMRTYRRQQCREVLSALNRFLSRG
ncbi:hypothetical protein MYX84_05315 [Acidobacteria bacterium AH-259-O06]|nr:hypothetical protein [Acidobacteria bacterium AH-259-O06]